MEDIINIKSFIQAFKNVLYLLKITLVALNFIMKKFWFILFSLGTLVSQEKVDLLSFGAGVFNIRKEKNRTSEYRVEYKFHQNLWGVKPFLGFLITARSSNYTYVGVYIDIYPKKPLFFSLNLAAGYYNKGNGKDLGFPLEFRSGIELTYKFKSLKRIGAHFYHISNASLGDKNSGTECLDFFISFPIRYKN
ncbi:MAG: hypothetical protein K1060chlam5_00897 [Candidatus Anoxychlamydiales bacterium]|nr:hypothetical protein [Candidatus Anoxychlamydiales bacterium]